MADLVHKRLVHFSKGCTKALLIQALQNIPGNPVLKAYDSEESDDMPITGFAYDEQEVIFYTDEP